MAGINLLIAIDERGNGAIGLAETDVLRALPHSPRIAIAQVSVWTLCGAILRAAVVPLRFTHQWTFRSTTELRRAG